MNSLETHPRHCRQVVGLSDTGARPSDGVNDNELPGDSCSKGAPTLTQAPKHLTSNSSQIYFIVNLMQIVALSFIKSSCVLFYRRVFRTGVSKAIDRSLLALLAIIVLWGVAFFITFLSLCGSHVDYAWSTVANELKCASTTMADQALSISDVITDLMILIFPMPLVTIIDIYRTESY